MFDHHIDAMFDAMLKKIMLQITKRVISDCHAFPDLKDQYDENKEGIINGEIVGYSKPSLFLSCPFCDSKVKPNDSHCRNKKCCNDLSGVRKVKDFSVILFVQSCHDGCKGNINKYQCHRRQIGIIIGKDGDASTVNKLLSRLKNRICRIIYQYISKEYLQVLNIEFIS